MDPSFKADLNEYISQCKIRLQKILQELDWTERGTIKNNNTNSIAALTNEKLKKSVSKSTFPASCVTENCVVLGTTKLQSILKNNEIRAPENFQELQANFSAQEKLKIYEHVIENTKKIESNLLEKGGQEEISLADILAQKKREEKRKKRRFRKSKPTHIEEVRCLVDIQMQALEQFMGNRAKNEKQATSLNMNCKDDDQGNRTKHMEKRFFEGYDKNKAHREVTAEYHKMKNHRIEPIRIKRRSRVESYCATKSDVKSISKEKGRHNRSSSRNKSREKRKHRGHSRSRSNDRLKDGRSKTAGKEISDDKKHSKRSHYELERNDSYQKYSSRSKFNNHSRENYNNEKYYRNQSRSPERSRRKR